MIRIFSIRLLTAILSALMIGGCATLPEDFDRPVSHAYTDTDDSRLGREHSVEMAAHPGQSGFFLLDNGLDAFVARGVLAQVAERSIDAQYYLLHGDLTGRLFIYSLIKAADRGIRVRLLVDDMDLAGRDLGASVLDSHPNAEMRIFNPFSRNTARITQFVTRLGSVTRRMHNKSFSVDNQVTILGGRNIGNEYFEADPDLEFADLDVLAIGPVVNEVSASFDQYWNSELAYPATVLRGKSPTPEEIKQTRQLLDDFVAQQTDSAYLQALKNSNLANLLRSDGLSFYWGNSEVVYDKPEKILRDRSEKQYHLAPMLSPYFNGVRDELIIFSPYFVPGKEGTAFLTQLSQRGVRVRILTNSLASNDVGLVHAGYAKYRKALLRGGVELYELNMKLTKKQRKEKKGDTGSSKASLHAKSFVFDRRQVFIGSLNLDPRAVVENTEIGVVFNSKEVAGLMGERFDENIEEAAFRLELKKNKYGDEKLFWYGMVDGEQQEFTTDPYTGFWRRFGLGFMGILPIESQL